MIFDYDHLHENEFIVRSGNFFANKYYEKKKKSKFEINNKEESTDHELLVEGIAI